MRTRYLQRLQKTANERECDRNFLGLRGLIALATFFFSLHAFSMQTRIGMPSGYGQFNYLNMVLPGYPLQGTALSVRIWQSLERQLADIKGSEDEDVVGSGERERIRAMLFDACENFLTILPKQLGCCLCQQVHTLLGSQPYQHYLERKAQLEHLKSLLEETSFDPERALEYLHDVMRPFHGRFGKLFYHQCLGLLLKFIPRDKRQQFLSAELSNEQEED